MPSNTTFILIKVVTDGTTAPDTAHVWFNPQDLTVEPTVATADITDGEVDLSSEHTVLLWADGLSGNGANAAFQVDELRVGTTFADVTEFFSTSDPPSILSDPEDLHVVAGLPASFMVEAIGGAPLIYHWYYNTNTLLTVGTNSTFTIPTTELADAGTYSVVVTNASGSATSAVAVLTVEPPTPPSITSPPEDTLSSVGGSALFSVSATGSAPLSYQWYREGGTVLTGETNQSLSLAVESTNAQGGYQVRVTNAYGTATSPLAQLTVYPPLPAFPGADGAARYVSGGRGGVVYHVTKLNSQLDDPERNSPGTFLYGLDDSNFPPGPRTVVFDVGGVFHLGLRDTIDWTSAGNAWNGSSRQGISADDLRIDGASAPGPVIFMGGTLKPQGDNQIIRNITIAAGYGMENFWEPGESLPVPGILPTSFTMDGMDLSGQNIMVDHVDVFYGSDESISWNEFGENITIQYCNNALAQNYDSHAFGHLLQADTDHKVSFIHNLDAHIRGRLPRVGSEVGTGALNDFRNNVTYNWLGTAGYSGSGQSSKNNFIANFYLAGPGGDKDWNSTEGGGTGIFNGGGGNVDAYRAGNVKDINKDGDPGDTIPADADITNLTPQSSAYDIEIGVTLDAVESFTNVLRHVGSRWWERDYDVALGNTGAIDTIGERIVHDVMTVGGRIEAWADDPHDSDPDEGKEWRDLWALRMDTNGAAPFNHPSGWDVDGDGMPGDWEEKHGLNPDVADANGDFDNDLYLNLEEYLNEIAAWPAPGEIVFSGEHGSRYALIYNWKVFGVEVNINGLGAVTTFSLWQPSRHDTAVITNQAVVVDAPGQHAGTLKLMSAAVLDVADGWLEVARHFDNGTGCVTTVSGSAALTASNLLNHGTVRLTGSAELNVSGTFTNAGTLDIMTWNGTLPGGLVNLGTILDASAIEITDYEISGDDVLVTLQGYAGHQYQLQYREGLTSGAWQDVGAPVAGADAPIVFNHMDGAGSLQRLYRVVVD
jgi:hypothetical protein